MRCSYRLGIVGHEPSDEFKRRELFDMFLLVVSGGIAIGSLLVLLVIVEA